MSQIEWMFYVPGVFLLGMSAFVGFLCASSAIEEFLAKHRRRAKRRRKASSVARTSAKRAAHRSPAKAHSH